MTTASLSWLSRAFSTERFPRWISHLEATRPKVFYPGDTWVLNRTACLGSDVLKMAFPELSSNQRFHLQKARIDSLPNHLLSQPVLKRNIIPLRFRSFIARDDVWSLVDQQNSRLWGQGSAPRFCLLDSYSELTDQKFRVRNSSKFFYANFSDVSKAALASGLLKSEGLLDLNELTLHFETLISTIARRWGSIPIILLTYPRDLETRELFLGRSLLISEIFHQLASRYDNVHVLRGPQSKIQADPTEIAEDRVFPYHYNSKVKKELAANLGKICASNGILHPLERNRSLGKTSILS